MILSSKFRMECKGIGHEENVRPGSSIRSVVLYFV